MKIKLTKWAEKAYDNAIKILKEAGFQPHDIPQFDIDTEPIHIIGKNVPELRQIIFLDFKLFVPDHLIVTKW